MVMENSRAFTDFFKTLKVTIKNSSIYNQEHPAYLESLKELKNKLDGLFMDAESLKMSFSPNSIFVKEVIYEKDKLYIGLANIFHKRKIKTIIFKNILTQDELKYFISKLCLPPGDLIIEGGLLHCLEQEDIKTISVEELDYSQLLKGEGEEIKDVWSFLLKEAIADNNQKKMEEVLANFEKVIEEFDIDEIEENLGEDGNFTQFFNYLKGTRSEDLKKCTKTLIRSLIRNKKITENLRLDNLKKLLMDVDDNDIASSFWEEVITDDNFDPLSFSIFSKLMEKKKKDAVESSLSNIIDTQAENRGSDFKVKIKELFSGSSTPIMSSVYLKTLKSIDGKITYQASLEFDRQHLQKNFWYMLLNMFTMQIDKKILLRRLSILNAEWENITQSGDFEIIKNIYHELKEKEAEIGSEEEAIKLKTEIIAYVEEKILSGELSEEFDYFIVNIDQSICGLSVYLEKIFDEKIVTPYVLKAVFRFFIGYLFKFNAKITEKANDTKFLELLVNNLKKIDSAVSLVALKTIYKLENQAIKPKVLKAMLYFSDCDENFLFPLLKKKDISIKRASMLILIKHPVSRVKALDKLFNIESPYGIRNKTIKKHIKIADEMNLLESKDHLIALTKRGNFWNRGLREMASEVLERWDAREN